MFSLIATLVGLAAFFALASVPTSLNMQTLLALCLLGLMAIAYEWSRRITKVHPFAPWLRLIVILTSAFLGWHYLYWRATETLPLGFGLLSMIAGLLLFVVEVYGFITLMFGHFINISPLERRPVLLPENESLWPVVDIFIPTYNEDNMVIRPTVIAATQMRYATGKAKVWILDDGGTEQKCNDKDPKKAEAARTRKAELKELGISFGAGYLTRERNEHAKAGNLNSALKYTSGELVAILDCDHIPTDDFLMNTVGAFLNDPQLFLLQTPHNFISADPVEKNLNIYGQIPSENELFYRVMQPGLDFWHTSFFCGSAAVLRRKVLDELGGIAGQTITEDAETTLDALSLGYTTAYLNIPMVSGLQPETYSGLVIQRVRWGQGMLQIFMLKNPWLQPKLLFVQRLLYTNFTTYWGFAIARLVLMLSPPAYLIFGLNLADTDGQQLIAYSIPYLLASLIVTQFYYRDVRWPFISQVYETIQSVYVTEGLFKVFLQPRSPSFKVTPKGEQLDQAFLSSLAWPFYLLLSINLLSLGFVVLRLFNPQWHASAVLFVGSWAILDLFFILAALGITLERTQRRTEPRVSVDHPVRVIWQDQIYQ
jgi:cellulose synthase (UDP-forming)